ncbi:MAG: flagellar FlbD family protein [Endomicrobiales bacterium]|jgi:flagellar protein FlbD
MIKLHRLNGQEVILNAELIETVDAVPDTVINLVNGNRFVVKESMETVFKLALEYRQAIARPGVSGALTADPNKK